jgi:hypothetical protein
MCTGGRREMFCACVRFFAQVTGDIRRQWSVSGYPGLASSGPVVRRSFTAGSAVFIYLENAIQF